MIQIGDLKKGMYLNNDGPGNILVYDQLDTTQPPMLTIAPGQMIGQVVDFKNSPGGASVVFSSDQISSAVPFSEKVTYYVNPLLWATGYRITGIVLFNDLQKNVNDYQVQTQDAAIKNADANGVTIANSFKEVTSGIADAVEGAIPWTLLAVAAGGYVVLNWNKFFKPVSLKK